MSSERCSFTVYALLVKHMLFVKPEYGVKIASKEGQEELQKVTDERDNLITIKFLMEGNLVELTKQS